MVVQSRNASSPWVCSASTPWEAWCVTATQATLKNDLRVSAKGQMYEDNTLILNMTYEGEAETNERSFKIYGDGIRMAAIRN